MSSFPKRVAILGNGFGTRVTAPALRAEGWEIEALFSRRPERAVEIATKLSIAHYSDDALAVIARDDIDAVIVVDAPFYEMQGRRGLRAHYPSWVDCSGAVASGLLMA